MRLVVHVPAHELAIGCSKRFAHIFWFDVAIGAGAVRPASMTSKCRLLFRRHRWCRRGSAQYPGRRDHPVLALRAVHRGIGRPEKIVTHSVEIARRLHPCLGRALLRWVHRSEWLRISAKAQAIPGVASAPGVVAVAQPRWIQYFCRRSRRARSTWFKMRGDHGSWVQRAPKYAANPLEVRGRIVEPLHLHVCDRQIDRFPPIAMPVSRVGGERGKMLLIGHVPVNRGNDLAKIVFADSVFCVVPGRRQSGQEQSREDCNDGDDD